MTGRLLVTAGDFGWGAAGKLSLILRELTGVPLIGVGGDISRALLTELEFVPGVALDRRTLSRVVSDHDVRAALVVGSNPTALALIDIGVPVVFVDSLPWLWTERDEVPVDADVYCAQMCSYVPKLAWSTLRGIRGLRWVEAIVPPPRRRVGGAGAVVSVGGLHSSLSGGAAEMYVRAVVPPVLAGLADAGVKVAGVCGNLDPGLCRMIRAAGPVTQVGPLPPQAFDRLLRSADLLVTSPGSTTLLQAHWAGLPVLMLPPQNVSQVMNTEWFACGATWTAIGWPGWLFDRARLDKLRPEGEEAAIAYMYDVVRGAAGDPDLHADLRARVAATVPRVVAEFPDRGHVALLGRAGAHQVAHVTRQMAFAPMTRRLRANRAGAAAEGNGG